MNQTSRLSLPYIFPNQAQKHVTHNEALRLVDVLVQTSVKSMTVADQPLDPGPGDTYLLPGEATGSDWLGHPANTIANHADGAWQFLLPQTGWQCFVEDAARRVTFDGTGWHDDATLGGSLAQFGVNAEADTTNRLAVKSDCELLSHDDVTPGSGDARKIINKAGPSATASVVFQSDWQGRAEFGLVGDDDFTLKVSSDGATFHPAARFDADTAAATFPGGVLHPASGVPQRSLIPLAGGDGTVSIYRINPSRAQNPRSFTLASVSGTVLTLSAPTSDQVFNHAVMGGVSMVRLWNTSLSPNQPAWIVGAPDASSLAVLDASSVTDWTSGHSVQVGDPTGITGGRVIALDISPMLQATLGAVFYQSGLILRMAAVADSGNDCGLDTSPDGTGGSFLGTRGYAGETSSTAQFLLVCPVPSPVSESNLVFIRENAFSGSVGISIASVSAVLV